MDFSEITEVTIPQGNVEKIEETNGGRVLWENVKVKLNTPKWAVYASNLTHTNNGVAEPVVSMASCITGNPIQIALRVSGGDELFNGPSLSFGNIDAKSWISEWAGYKLES